MKTQIGLPVQFIGNTPKGREIYAAIIVDLKDYPHAETDLMVFTKGAGSFYATNVRHKDFKKDGENYWDFLEEPLTENDVSKEESMKKTVTLESSEYEKLMKYEKFINTFLAKFEGYDALFKPLDTGMDLAYKILDKVKVENEELLECKVFLHRFLADFAPDEVFSPTYLALEKAYSLLPKLREGSKPFLLNEKK